MTARPVHVAAIEHPKRPSQMPLQRLARLTGALYILLVVLGMLGPLTLESMLVAGDPTATAENIADAGARFDLSLIAWVVIVAFDVSNSETLYLIN